MVRHLVATSYGQILRAASVVVPHNLWLIKRRSKWLRSRGDAGSALALIDRALRSAPLNERLVRERMRLLADLAEMRLAAGDANAAAVLIDQLLAAALQDEGLIRRRADICARLARRRRADGDAAGALSLLDRALTGMPQSEQLLRERAFAVARLADARHADGDPARALMLIDEALVQRPADLRLLAARAGTLHALRNYREAMQAWRRCTELAPTDVRGWSGMARALYMMDSPELIEPLIAEYLRALGDLPERYVRATRVALSGRQTALFERLLARARAGAHRNAGNLRELAALHLGAGEVGEALNCLDGVLALDPHDQAAKAKRQDTVRALRLAGVDAETMAAPRRAALRMPDLALQALLQRAPALTRQATGKIAMVYTTLGPGGAERQLANTVSGLADLAGSPKVVLMPMLDDDPEIHRFHLGILEGLQVPVQSYHRGDIDMPLLRTALGADAADLFAILPRTLREQIGVLTSRFLRDRPRAVHAWSDYRNITAGIAAVLAGVPRVVLSTRTVAPPGTRTVPTYFGEIYRALLDRPGVALVNNSAAGARTYAEWLGIEAERVGVIYNGVDFHALEQARDPRATAAHRARLGLPAGARVVGSAFRLGRVKRPLLWLEAAAEVARRCDDAHFVIVGEGPLRDSMATAAAELGIADRLHMPGLTRDVAPWYDLMDVVLLTSEREGTSNTALEAQALGKPVVAPAVGGMPETFIPGTSGFLVSANPTPDEIAECVTRALLDGAWRDEAERTARAFIRERFSIERMIGDTVEFYGLQRGSAASMRQRVAV